jgi:hypothetical protein
MPDDSAIRIELALRGGMIAKAALELTNLAPELGYLQLVEVVKHVRETDEFLKKMGVPR